MTRPIEPAIESARPVAPTPRTVPGSEELLDEGRSVLRAEAEALLALAGRLGPEFVQAVHLLNDTSGRIIVTGVGKSGIVARKIAATLTSTGTPASFLHPVDGLHGDLGIVSRKDAAIFISKSGGTAELHGLMEYMVRLGLPIIGLTGRLDSALGRACTVALDCNVPEEACPLDLAPTSSTTAALAMGDALAMVLLRLKGFRAEDFARFHPGGALGRRLTLRVSDVMVSSDLPGVGLDSTIQDCIVPLAHMRGTVPVLDSASRVQGVITTGDLTRLMDETPDFLDRPVSEVMTASPRVTSPDRLAGGVLHEMQEHGIMALPVVTNESRLVGMVHLHDILRSEAAS